MSMQQEAITKIVDVLKQDDRLKAMFLKGSIARGEEDAYSDVDFYCVVHEKDIESFLIDRKNILTQYKPLLSYSEVYFVAPQVVGIFDNGLHFDLYTLTKAPKEGTDRIKILHDPLSILKDYKVNKNSIESSEVSGYINEFIYTLLEIEAAYKRNDILWALRLGSHNVASLSLVLAYLYHQEAPFLGMKRLQSKLPTAIKNKMIQASNQLNESDYLEAIKGLIDILESQLTKLDHSILDQIKMEFLVFMKKRIYELK